MSLRRVLSVKNLKPLWEEVVMVRQRTNSRVLCCYQLNNEMTDDEKAQLKTHLDLLMTVRHHAMRFIYEPTNPPYLFYAYCGGGSLQDIIKDHILHETKFTREDVLDMLYQLTSLCSYLYSSETGIVAETTIYIDPRCIFFDDHGLLRMEIGCPLFKMVYIKQRFDSTADASSIVSMTTLPVPTQAAAHGTQNLFYDVSGSIDTEYSLVGGIFTRLGETSEVDSELSMTSTSVAECETASVYGSSASRTGAAKGAGEPGAAPSQFSPRHLHNPLTRYQTQENSADICHHDRYIPPEYYTQGKDTAEGVVWSIGKLAYDICQLTLSLSQTKLGAVNKDYYKEGVDKEYGSDLAVLLRSMMQTNYKRRPTLSYILNLPLIKAAKRVFEERHGIVRDADGNTQLMLAARQGDVSTMAGYMYQRCLTNNSGETALILALKHGHEDASLALVDEECGYVDSDGGFAAKYSLAKGAGDVFQRLSVTEKYLLVKHGITHLMISAANGDSAGVAAYLDGNVRMVLNGPGTTALMMASAAGSLECVERLIEYEKQIQDSDGFTAMMHATVHARAVVVYTLSAHEANYLDNSGNSALIHAVFAHERTQSKIRQETAALRAGNIGPWSVRCGQLLNIVAHLAPLEKCHRATDGYTALMIASQYGNIRAVEALLKHESGMQALDGTTALMLAVRYRHTSVAKLLAPYEAGFATNAQSTYGQGYTALMEAAVQGDLEIVNLLGPKEVMLVQQPTAAFPTGKTAADWGTETALVTDTKTKQDILFALRVYQERIVLAEASVPQIFQRFLMVISPFIVLLLLLIRKRN